MKVIIFVLSFSILAFAQAWKYKPAVLNAKVDVEKKEISITVKHGGGCGEHNYTMVIGLCLESYPVQCSAEIFDKTDDMCEALLIREAVFTFEELGFDDPYFNGASINISGGKDYINGELVETSVSIKLPFKN